MPPENGNKSHAKKAAQMKKPHCSTKQQSNQIQINFSLLITFGFAYSWSILLPCIVVTSQLQLVRKKRETLESFADNLTKKA